MTAPARFKQADMTRAIKAAKAAGEKVERVVVAPDGSIVVYTDRAANDDARSDWDGL